MKNHVLYNICCIRYLDIDVHRVTVTVIYIFPLVSYMYVECQFVIVDELAFI